MRTKMKKLTRALRLLAARRVVLGVPAGTGLYTQVDAGTILRTVKDQPSSTASFGQSSILNFTDIRNFGRISGTVINPREVQFALKFYF
jgi:hypothetical protein